VNRALVALGVALLALVVALGFWDWISGYARRFVTAAPSPVSPSDVTPGPSIPPPIAPGQLAGLFGVSAEQPTSWGRVSLRTVRVADLVLPSGRINGADAFLIDGAGWLATLPAGRYSVELLLAAADGDERVAAARVVLPVRGPVTWQLALLPGQDPAVLGPGEFFGYGVDSGTGSFFSPEAAEHLDDAYADRLLDQLAEHQQTTWAWANVQVDAASGANVVAFSSGFGDGAYPSFVGLATDGRTVGLMTDFGLLDSP
jgi:hypothetical protein